MSGCHCNKLRVDDGKLTQLRWLNDRVLLRGVLARLALACFAPLCLVLARIAFVEY